MAGPTTGEPSSGSADVTTDTLATAEMGTPAPSERDLLARGTRLGRYFIFDVIGSGGMGVVYAAYDPELDRRIAIKLLHSSFGGEKGRARVLREAQTMARLAHPNVARIYDVGTLGEQVFIAMELVEGMTLREWLGAQPRSWREVVSVMLGAGRGLAAAHDAGVVHRDVKPTNILVTSRGDARVVDFGVACAADELSEPGHAGDGEIVGTPAYMAPEQLRGIADARSDQYSFCQTLAEALTGSMAPPPSVPMSASDDAHETPSALGASIQRRTRRAGRPATGRAPRRLLRALRRGLATDSDQRHPDMHALLRALSPPASWSRALAVTAVTAAAAASLAAWLTASRAASPLEQCLAGGDAAAQVVSREAREAIRARFGEAGRSYGRDTADRVIELLDQRARAWREARTAACTATWRAGTQSELLLDRRIMCLERRFGELSALVGVFRGPADGALVDGAVQAVAALPPVSACADLERLAASYPEPAEPDRAARATALRRRLEEVHALGLAGRYDAAVAAGTTVAADAETLDHPPVTAEALFELGVSQLAAGDGAAGEATLTRGVTHAARARDDPQLAMMAAKLLWTIGYQQERADEALATTALAEAAVVRAGNDPLLRAELENSLGAARLGKNDNAAARAHFERALALYLEGYDPDDPRLGKPLNNVGLVAHYEGDQEAAIAYLERARDTWEAGYGPDHPQVALALNNLGMAFKAADRIEEAAACFERALAIFERALGPDHPDVAMALVNFGSTLSVAGRLDEAQRAYERSLAIRERRLGPDHSRVGVSAQNVGAILTKQGKPADAAPHHARALRIFEAVHGAEHLHAVIARMSLGEALRDSGDPGAAIPVLERALADAQAHHPDLVPTIQFALARALWTTGHRRPRALSLARAARDAWRAEKDAEQAEADAWLAAHQARR